MYDDVAQRFYVGILEGSDPSFTHADFDFAVSRNSNPTDFSSANWAEFTKITSVEEGATNFADFPKMGYNADAIFVSFNQFPDNGGPVHDLVLAISKSAVLAGQPLVFNQNYFQTDVTTDQGGNGDHRILIPSQMHSSTLGVEWFVQTDNESSTVNVVKETNYLSASPSFTTTTLTVNPYRNSPGVPGLTGQIDDRILFADFRNDKLVATGNVGLADGLNHARWYEFDTSGATPSLIQQGDISPGAGISTSYPGIAIDANGDIGMSYIQNSSSQNPSMYVTARLASDPLNTMETPVLSKAGVTALDGIRGGDYSYAGVDPVNGTFWAANEYGDLGGFAGWGTWISNFTAVRPAGAYVFSQNPAGTVDGSAINGITFVFSEPMDTSSFSVADDVDSFTGPGGVDLKPQISGFTWLDNRTLLVSFPAQRANGTYTMVIGPQILRASDEQPMDQNLNQVAGEVPGDEYTATIDHTGAGGPRVVSESLSGTVFAPSVSTLDLTFSEAMDTSSFSVADDVDSFTGPGGIDLKPQITGFTWISNTQLRLTFNAQSAEGTYTLVVGPQMLATSDGTPLDQNSNHVPGEDPADRFTGSFTLSHSIAADAYGYQASVTPFQNLEIAGQPGTFTIIASGDDVSAPVNLGSNTFNFYGTNYFGATSLYVSTNGLITFGSGNTEYFNTDLSGGDPSQAAIAVLWDDWITGPGSPMVIGQFQDTNGDGTPDQLVIEWNQVNHYSSSPSAVTAQAILELNSSARPGLITLNYPDLNTGDSNSNGASATVGIKGAGVQGPNRLLVSYNNGTHSFLQSGTAIRIAANTINDPGFETPEVGNNFFGAFQYNPSGSPWTFTGGAGVSGNNSGFTSGNPAAPQGDQVAFLQATGQASQSVSFVAGTYTLSFQAAQRGNYQASNQTFEVLIDNAVVGTFTPTSTNYAGFTTSAFTVTAGAHVISFVGLNPNGGDNTAFVDDVRINVASSNQPSDPGFETPVVGNNFFGAFQYDPTGSPWTFTGGAGVSGNNSGFTAGNPAAPQGSQVGFLQGAGAQISQSVNFNTGGYTLSFQAAQRGNYQASSQTFEVLIDSTVVGTFTPGSTSYASFTTGAFTVTAGAHTISFVGLNPNGGDNTAFIDSVQVNSVTIPTVANATFETPNVGTGFFGAFVYDPTGAGWTFNGGAGVAGNNSGFTSGNPNAPDGTQVGFLQQTGSFSQLVSFATGGTYTISFQAAQRGNYQASSQAFQVLVDGSAVGTFTPAGTSYAALVTNAFTVTAGSHTISFAGLNPNGGDNTAFVDGVAVNPVAAVALVDSSFAKVNVGEERYFAFRYNPTGTAWTFEDGAGVAANGSGFTQGNPDAPEGDEVAFLQGAGARIGQSLDFEAPAVYTLSFQAAQRGNWNQGGQAFQVLIDGVVVGTFTPAGTDYTLYTTNPFAVTAGVHTISFLGLNPLGGDNTAFIDSVRLNLVTS
jgi:hypothetical protein